MLFTFEFGIFHQQTTLNYFVTEKVKDTLLKHKRGGWGYWEPILLLYLIMVPILYLTHNYWKVLGIKEDLKCYMDKDNISAIDKYLNKRPKGPLSLTWVQSTLQKFNFGMEPKTTTLQPTCFKIIAMHSVCCYNLLGWRSFWNVPPSLMDWPGWQFLFTFQVKICLSQSEARAAILLFGSARKTQTW